ncbi:hypothetical protein BKM17_27045 [Pseudomonas syringae group genomosp. 3]|nr:hypothetical protein BKM17_27045 [Pseudomonas syringae group genomosp. 3]
MISIDKLDDLGPMGNLIVSLRFPGQLFRAVYLFDFSGRPIYIISHQSYAYRQVSWKVECSKYHL